VRKVATLTLFLAVAAWVVLGTVASADSGRLLGIRNRLPVQVEVKVYSHNDAIRLIPCWYGVIGPNQSVEITYNPWAVFGCHLYDAYVAVVNKAELRWGPMGPTVAYEYHGTYTEKRYFSVTIE